MLVGSLFNNFNPVVGFFSTLTEKSDSMKRIGEPSSRAAAWQSPQEDRIEMATEVPTHGEALLKEVLLLL